ncbi:hypothetical protein HGRIS_008880 [Hohenbuehelia grisea]|uniref:Uncharacterized protein n=1 Tax=Hohenbuehelia grisea TaxID=104357 RepID=A0ABR3IZG6_9AGAR
MSRTLDGHPECIRGTSLNPARPEHARTTRTPFRLAKRGDPALGFCLCFLGICCLSLKDIALAQQLSSYTLKMSVDIHANSQLVAAMGGREMRAYEHGKVEVLRKAEGPGCPMDDDRESLLDEDEPSPTTPSTAGWSSFSSVPHTPTSPDSSEPIIIITEDSTSPTLNLSTELGSQHTHKQPSETFPVVKIDRIASGSLSRRRLAGSMTPTTTDTAIYASRTPLHMPRASKPVPSFLIQTHVDDIHDSDYDPENSLATPIAPTLQKSHSIPRVSETPRPRPAKASSENTTPVLMQRATPVAARVAAPPGTPTQHLLVPMAIRRVRSADLRPIRPRSPSLAYVLPSSHAHLGPSRSLLFKVHEGSLTVPRHVQDTYYILDPFSGAGDAHSFFGMDASSLAMDHIDNLDLYRDVYGMHPRRKCSVSRQVLEKINTTPPVLTPNRGPVTVERYLRRHIEGPHRRRVGAVPLRATQSNGGTKVSRTSPTSSRRSRTLSHGVIAHQQTSTLKQFREEVSDVNMIAEDDAYKVAEGGFLKESIRRRRTVPRPSEAVALVRRASSTAAYISQSFSSTAVTRSSVNMALASPQSAVAHFELGTQPPRKRDGEAELWFGLMVIWIGTCLAALFSLIRA